jgi:ABC-type transporter Mla subunit MlaD
VSVSESSTNVRVEGVEASLGRVLDKLDTLGDRISDMREQLAGLRGTLDNVKSLVDGVHKRAAELELRVEALENERSSREGEAKRGALVAAGSAATGGGLIAGAIELVRRLLE